MSERRLLGWEPTEYHDHEYDAAGRLLRTVVTREPEWDDYEREKLAALVQYEAEICACGLHESVADEDPDLELTPRRCPVCAGLEQTMRTINEQDETAVAALGKSPAPEVERPSDGRTFSLRHKVSPEVARLLKMLGRR